MASSVEDRLTEECPQQCAARRRSEPRIRHLNTLRCNLATPAKDDFGGIARGGLRKRLPRIGNRLQPPRLLKTACVGAALGRMAQLPGAQGGTKGLQSAHHGEACATAAARQGRRAGTHPEQLENSLAETAAELVREQRSEIPADSSLASAGVAGGNGCTALASRHRQGQGGGSTAPCHTGRCCSSERLGRATATTPPPPQAGGRGWPKLRHLPAAAPDHVARTHLALPHSLPLPRRHRAHIVLAGRLLALLQVLLLALLLHEQLNVLLPPCQLMFAGWCHVSHLRGQRRCKLEAQTPRSAHLR
mmetsp:Transcript_73540/g.157604  ORF Transcript_73540/g.157604 Transcript_73540/m.157604 type:complete len:304 (-) Transcript_73540:727-1638(-)